MELKSSKIKNMSDFVIGLALLAGGLWLMFSSNITEGRILTAHQVQGMLRADTYIKVLGGLVSFLAFIMVVRSFNFDKTSETQAFKFSMSKESLLTFVGLALFIILLRPLGFALVTFLFSFSIICLYMFKEIKNKGLDRGKLIKKVIFTVVFSLLLVLAVYLIFGKVLLVQLP